jgi:hypothetical protein
MEHFHRKLTFYSSNVYSPPQESYGIGNSFYPLEGLRREDADIALIFLGTSQDTPSLWTILGSLLTNGIKWWTGIPVKSQHCIHPITLFH